MLLSGTALAGCVTPDSPPAPEATDDMEPAASLADDSFTVTIMDFPANVTANESFTFMVALEGAPESASDHIGAHFGRNTSAAPSTTVYDSACAHTAGTAPGNYTVTCSMADAGTWYLRGHLRLVDNGTTFNYWSTERMVEVAPAAETNDTMPDDEEPALAADSYTVTTNGVPATAQAETAFSFTVTVAGNTTMMSDHIGAHFGNETSPEANVTVYPYACIHSGGEVPGTYEVSCTVLTTGIWYLRGHMRAMSGGETFNYWGEEQTIVVA